MSERTPPRHLPARPPQKQMRPTGDRSEEPLDPKLRRWLEEEIKRRELPHTWIEELLPKLIAWATTYRDGKALHDLLCHYPKRTKGEQR